MNYIIRPSIVNGSKSSFWDSFGPAIAGHVFRVTPLNDWMNERLYFSVKST